MFFVISLKIVQKYRSHLASSCSS